MCQSSFTVIMILWFCFREMLCRSIQTFRIFVSRLSTQFVFIYFLFERTITFHGRQNILNERPKVKVALRVAVVSQKNKQKSLMHERQKIILERQNYVSRSPKISFTGAPSIFHEYPKVNSCHFIKSWIIFRAPQSWIVWKHTNVGVI